MLRTWHRGTEIAFKNIDLTHPPPMSWSKVPKVKTMGPWDYVNTIHTNYSPFTTLDVMPRKKLEIAKAPKRGSGSL